MTPSGASAEASSSAAAALSVAGKGEVDLVDAERLEVRGDPGDSRAVGRAGGGGVDDRQRGLAAGEPARGLLRVVGGDDADAERLEAGGEPDAAVGGAQGDDDHVGVGLRVRGGEALGGGGLAGAAGADERDRPRLAAEVGHDRHAARERGADQLLDARASANGRPWATASATMSLASAALRPAATRRCSCASATFGRSAPRPSRDGSRGHGGGHSCTAGGIISAGGETGS